MAKLDVARSVRAVRDLGLPAVRSLKTAFVLYAAGGLLAGAALSVASTGLLGLAAESTLPDVPCMQGGTYIFDAGSGLLVPAEALSWYAAGRPGAQAGEGRSVVLYVESPEERFQESVDPSDHSDAIAERPVHDAAFAEDASAAEGAGIDLSQIALYDERARQEREGTEAAADLASILPENSDGQRPLVSNVGYLIACPGEPAAYRTLAGLAIATVPLNFLACLVVAGRLFYRNRVRRPLEQMDLATKRIASGDLSFAMPAQRDDELGRLCRRFSEMRSELERAERKLWQSAENRRKVNAAFAHDLRTPLTVIAGQAEVLSTAARSGALDPERASAASEAILRQARRLEGYADSMADLDSLEARASCLSAVDVGEWFDETADDVQALAGRRGLAVEARRGSLPGPLMADKAALSQIAENLSANAVRHAGKQVRFSCSWTEGVLEVSVDDDGPGFSDRALERACDPFWRDGERGGADDGAHFGLGLCICETLCRQFGGSLTLGVSPLGGARVVAKVPASEAPTGTEGSAGANNRR